MEDVKQRVFPKRVLAPAPSSSSSHDDSKQRDDPPLDAFSQLSTDALYDSDVEVC